MPVVINGSTGISTPGLSSTADVTLAGSGVELLNNSGRIVVGQSGSVIQVVSTPNATQTTTTSTTFVATGVSATITPTSTSSRIVAICTANLDNEGSGGYAVQGTIVRNGTALTSPATMGRLYSSGTRVASMITLVAQDSPASTSALTYTLNILSSTGATVSQGSTGQSATMTLMEIAG